MAVTSIRNETPARLTLVSLEGEQMVLAPLEEREVEESSGFDFDDLAREGVVSQRAEAPSSVAEQISVAVLGGGFWLVIGALVVSGFDPWFGVRPEAWPYAVWGAALAVLVVVVTVLVIRGTNSLSLVVRWTMQTAALTVILAIGVGLPALSIYFFGGGPDLLAGFATEGGAVPATGPEAEQAAGAPRLMLFGRLLQLALIATASLLPTLLFFLFHRYQLGTMRKRLYLSLFRLDRELTTTGEINAKYGSQIAEAYGSDREGRGRYGPGSRSPVLVCAFVMTVGWILALMPVGTDFAPADAAGLLESLLPQRSAVVFGFLGAYFFSLRLIALRYARGDLRPKAYAHIVVRIFVVIVLSWVLEAVFEGDSNAKLVLAFLFGITPDEFFTWVKEAFRGVVPSSAVPDSTLPLNELEGIDLYDLGRLESEGIVNVEGLAHHDLVDLIIETRIPVPRLIDWVDQAILYLHLVGGSDSGARTRLRDYGIRTATDLLQAWDRVEERAEAGGSEEMDAFKRLLGDNGPPHRLEVIRDALLDDEWMSAVRCWRDDAAHAPLRREAVPSTPEALQRRADRELEEKRFGRALAFLNQTLQKQDSAGARRRIASIYARADVPELRNTDLALEHAAHAFQLAPNDYSGTVELLELYLDLGRRDEARRMYDVAREALEAWPSAQHRDKQRQGKRLEELQARLDGLDAGDGGSVAPTLPASDG